MGASCHECWVWELAAGSLLPSDNATIREMYLHQRMSDCHLELLAVCQEGELTLKSMAVDIDDGEPAGRLGRPVVRHNTEQLYQALF